MHVEDGNCEVTDLLDFVHSLFHVIEAEGSVGHNGKGQRKLVVQIQEQTDEVLYCPSRVVPGLVFAA